MLHGAELLSFRMAANFFAGLENPGHSQVFLPSFTRRLFLCDCYSVNMFTAIGESKGIAHKNKSSCRCFCPRAFLAALRCRGPYRSRRFPGICRQTRPAFLGQPEPEAAFRNIGRNHSHPSTSRIRSRRNWASSNSTAASIRAESSTAVKISPVPWAAMGPPK